MTFLCRCAVKLHSFILNVSRNKLPHSDFRQIINPHYLKQWQQYWNDEMFNEVHSTKPVLAEWLTGNPQRR
jgi:hypothetical protein